jgi:hypothetical protein
MPMIAGTLALAAEALFAGGALHITLAEQPARLGLDDSAMLAQWKPSFERAQRMAIPLAILGLGLGLFAWWKSGNLAWVTGAFLVGLNIPFTLIAIKPTNDVLLATTAARAGPDSRALIAKWGRLHAIRVVLALAATAAFIWASVK